MRDQNGHGAGIALWHGRSLLLVRTSYRPTIDLPGGGMEPGEDTLAAALRELREEVGIELPPGLLGEPIGLSFRHEHRAITSAVYVAHLEEMIPPVIDHAEIVWADYVSVEELAGRKLAPGLIAYLQITP